MNEQMDERYGLDTPQEREREATDLRAKYEALEKENADLKKWKNESIERLQDICEENGCPGGWNRLDFLQDFLRLRRKEIADLKQQVADGDLAFNHANEVVGKLEAQVARLSAPVSHAGCRVVTAEGFASDPNYLEQSWPVTVEVDLRCHECRTTPAKEK